MSNYVNRGGLSGISALILGLSACNTFVSEPVGDESGPLDSIGGTLDPDDGGSGDSGGQGSSTDTSVDDTGDADDAVHSPRFDVGFNETGSLPVVESGCQKVDVILSVDNSSSMSEEHDALAGPVFDSFPQALLDINNGIEDFQLAVIDACPKPAKFHNWGTGGACNFSTGANYMSSTSLDLATEFACVTSFPADGYDDEPDACIDSGAFGDDDEQPGLTAAESISMENLDGANSGFLREDAILFVVAITDEDEEVVDIGSVQEIHDMIVDAKGGDVTRVAYLGIAGDSNCNGPYGSADDATQSKALTALFEAEGQGMFWDLCQGDLETAFQTAITTLVDDTCQTFEPPG